MTLFQIHQGTKASGDVMPLHRHEEAQLTFAAPGVVQVHTDLGRWLVPPQLAVWVPPGVLHRIELLTDAELWVVHWQSSAVREWAPVALRDRGAYVLQVTPLLQCLLDAAVTQDPESTRAELIGRLMLHELTQSADAPTFLPWPVSTGGQRLAETAFADGRNQMSLKELASHSAISVRSASRMFPAETGLTFKAWRQRARIVRSIDRLARGETIKKVASGAGFSSTAAFSSAFRQVVGMSPGEFFQQPAPESESNDR